jgi:hypothetical protein
VIAYPYRCRSCGRTQDSSERTAAILCVCGDAMIRDYRSVTLRPPVFRPHWNHAVGRYVETSRDFDEALRRGAEEQNTTYTRIDPGDYESITPSGDTQSIEDQAKAHRDVGLTQSKQTVIPL